MKQFAKSVISKATTYYTVAVLAFSVIMLLSLSGEEFISLDPFRVICLLPFCIIFAIANTILNNERIDSATRWIAHFILTVLSAFIFLILPAEIPESSGNFMGFVLIMAAYIICVLLYILFSKRIKNTMREDAKLKNKTK